MNGVQACHSPYMNSLLRNEYGFKVWIYLFMDSIYLEVVHHIPFRDLLLVITMQHMTLGSPLITAWIWPSLSLILLARIFRLVCSFIYFIQCFFPTNNLHVAINNGFVSQQTLDNAVVRILTAYYALGQNQVY